MSLKSPEIDLKSAAATIKASYAALPSPGEMERLIADSQNAAARGYYDPVEDERLREVYTRYLGIRTAIWQAIEDLKPLYKSFKTNDNLSDIQLQAFGVAFCGAEIIVRTGGYLIDLALQSDMVWKKLDEAEARYGLKRKSFTRLFRQLTSASKMVRFYKAVEFFDRHRSAILDSMREDYLQPVENILEQLDLPSASRGDHLKRYGRFVRFSLRRRRESANRNVLFSLFQGTGEDIAQLKIPFVKALDAPKRVSIDVIEGLLPDLRPGDVFITRHDDAMSNLFLPGFWPHGALHIGSADDRSALGVDTVSDGIRESSEAGINILEAKSDGVLLREISETLQLDAFVVMRPKLSEPQIRLALNRALSHAGKMYDFIFDFSTSDRLVCTELVYRAFHGIGKVDFKLSTKAGRNCLSAEDFLNQAIQNDWFEPVIIYGVGGDQRYDGHESLEKLRRSFAAAF